MDENVPRAITEGLRRRGIEVVTVQEMDMRGATDEEQLEFAAQHALVTFTQDTDFIRLLSRGIFHTGIVYAAQKLPIGEVLRGMILISEILNSEDMVHKIEYI